ncbi:uncharacterized protein [Diabrotica undecimpunctata]|uniref:uncharacterized protein n=1 Tax=Diabrotica undecimpunctata TaxID=50387 RepID=UPI003B636110
MSSNNIDNIIKQTDGVVLAIKKLRKILFDNFTIRDAEVWLKRLQKQIKLCKKVIRSRKQNKLSVGTCRKIETNLGHFKHFRKLILNRHIGSGLHLKLGQRVKWENVQSSFQSRIKTGIIANLRHKDLNQFLGDCVVVFKNKIGKILKNHSALKVNTAFCGEFIRKSGDNEILEIKYFNTKNYVIDISTQIDEWFKGNVVDKLLNELSEFAEKDSGFALNKIISLAVNINKFQLGNVSSYIRLPEPILKKNACINIKNTDHNCFYWAIVSALRAPINKNHAEETSSYPYFTEVLQTENLDSPMPLTKISKFEKLNNISVNVYALELVQTDKTLFYTVLPARLTENKRDTHVNLLLVQNKYYPRLNDYDAPPADDDCNEDIKYHYCWIKNLSRLVSSQLNKNNHKKFICDRCMNYFHQQNKLVEHEKVCSKFNKYKINFPKESHVEFKNFTYQQTTPFVVYADFECQLENYNQSNVNLTKTVKYQKHVPYSAGFYVKCNFDDNLSYFDSYRGADCMDWFANRMADVAKFVNSKIKTITPMIEKPNASTATSCHICSKSFSIKDIIVKDHDHFSGKFRGFAHQACNLNFRKLFVVPIIFHNLSGYDSHFMISNLCKKGHLSVLPINKDKYISFTLHSDENNIKLRFIDSFRFMGASLDELVSILSDSEKKILQREFQNLDENKFKLLTRKGVFCYDYIDSLEKLNEKDLPSIEKFYNKLNDETISDEKYAHAQAVWQHFNIQTIGEYSDIYLKTDILLLADVFEQLRKKCFSTYGLDPAWYYTMPGYTWDCMLKYTGCRLELLKDPDMVLFYENAIRGGISVCSNRFSEANNKYMSEYDPKKPSKYLMYLDVNNLYGFAMQQLLPYGGFKWVDDVTSFDVTSIPDNSDIGYVLQVDLSYPQELHDKHKDFPFAAERSVPPSGGVKLSKLMTTLNDKKEYTVHYKNLKQMLANGLKLTKIHKILQFKQGAWLKPYIELNTRNRAIARTDFEKNLYKLMNNAVFGKTMENIKKHRICKIAKSWGGRYGAANLISNFRFHSCTILEENLVVIELKKLEVTFNKPLYVGQAILDLSKTVMYDFHYNYMLPKMGADRCKLMYMDTDSFVYELQCEDVYEEVIKADSDKFDTSDYSENNIYKIPRKNKKVPGLMKDENNGKIMTHFVGLRSKMYSYKVQSGKIVKKSKGVKYNIVKNKIKFEDYVECLKNFKEKTATQRCIRSYAHNVYSIEQTKIGLSPYDDKRYLIPNSFDTLPWGHYSILE